MLLVSYDFTDDKIRTKFSKFLSKYGYRIQYSVFRIKNSKRLLQNIRSEIKLKYEKKFSKTDSIYVFQICEGCMKKIDKYGFAKYEDEDIIFLG
jgi:CRISPR-associated protein Cas2